MMTFEQLAFTLKQYGEQQKTSLALLRRVTSAEQRQRALATILSEFIWQHNHNPLFRSFRGEDIKSEWLLVVLYRQSGLDRYEGSPWEVGFWEITDCWPVVCTMLLLMSP